MGGFVFRRVQEGYHGEPAITRERKHFSKIHPSDCKPSTRLACSYLNWSEEVSAALCSAVDRTNDKTTTVTLRPRVNKAAVLYYSVSEIWCTVSIFVPPTVLLAVSCVTPAIGYSAREKKTVWHLHCWFHSVLACSLLQCNCFVNNWLLDKCHLKWAKP